MSAIFEAGILADFFVVLVACQVHAEELFDRIASGIKAHDLGTSFSPARETAAP